jgi:hypothetical protein
VKGADQCPKCGSRKWREPRVANDFYAIDVRVCDNCQTLWEPFDADALLDPRREPLGAFKHPCNNCAFRKGSPEQSDPEEFAKLREKLGWFGASFYCHKGVPIDIESEDGFAYPRDREGKPTPAKMRLCRGYLNQLGGFPLDLKYEELLKRKEGE